MTTTLSPWQRPDDGFPSENYFTAVLAELAKAGVEVEHGIREEAWEFNISLAPTAYMDGPLGWAEHGLYVVWRCDQDDQPTHADDFTGLGWCWVPYSKPDAGDFAKKFEQLPYLAEPELVAAAIVDLVKNG